MNTGIAGTYILEYSYTDTAGNYGMEYRTVNVLDSTGVIININDPNPYYIEYGDTYIEYGATRTDTIDGNGSVTGIVVNVDTGTLGT